MLRLRHLWLSTTITTTPCSSSVSFKHQFLHYPITSNSVRSKMETISYSTKSSSNKLLFRQLFEKESSTYTYLLADANHPDKPALVRNYNFLNFNLMFNYVNLIVF